MILSRCSLSLVLIAVVIWKTSGQEPCQSDVQKNCDQFCDQFSNFTTITVKNCTHFNLTDASGVADRYFCECLNSTGDLVASEDEIDDYDLYDSNSEEDEDDDDDSDDDDDDDDEFDFWEFIFGKGDKDSDSDESDSRKASGSTEKKDTGNGTAA